MVTYFRGLLDVFNEALKQQLAPQELATTAAAAAEQRVPSRQWPGWQAIADLLGVQADAPAFRAREAVKIALASDHLNLSGQDVDWAALEQRLESILSGGVTLTQLPDTEEDLRRQEPPRALILYEDVQKSRRRAGAGTRSYFVVLEGQKEEEEGEWFTHEELKRHFPNFREMKSEFEARCKEHPQQQHCQQFRKPLFAGQGQGGSLEEGTTTSDPSEQAAAAKASADGGRAVRQAEEPPQQQQQLAGALVAAPAEPEEASGRSEQQVQYAQQAQWAASHLVSTDGPPAEADTEAALSAAGKRAAPAAIPGGSSVPRQQQQQQQQQSLLGEGGKAPASILLAGVGVVPSLQRMQAPPAQPSNKPAVQQGQMRQQQQAVRQIIHPAPLGITQVTSAVEPVCRDQINERTVVVPPPLAAAAPATAAPRSPAPAAAAAPVQHSPQPPVGPARLPSEQQRPPRKLPPLLAALQPVRRPAAAVPPPQQRDAPAPYPGASLTRPLQGVQESRHVRVGAGPLHPQGQALWGQAALPAAATRDAPAPAGGVPPPAPSLEPSWGQSAAAALRRAIPAQQQQPHPAPGPDAPMSPGNGLFAAFGRPAATQPVVPAAMQQGLYGALPPTAPAAQAPATLDLRSVHPLLRRNVEYACRNTGRLPWAAPVVALEQRQVDGVDALLQLLPKPRGTSAASAPGPRQLPQPQFQALAPAAAPAFSLSSLLPQPHYAPASAAPALSPQRPAWMQPSSLAGEAPAWSRVQQQQQQERSQNAHLAANAQPAASVRGMGPSAAHPAQQAAAMPSPCARPGAAAVPSPPPRQAATHVPPLPTAPPAELRSPAGQHSPAEVPGGRPAKRPRLAEPTAAQVSSKGQGGPPGEQQAGRAEAVVAAGPAGAAAAVASQGTADSRGPGWSTDAEPDEEQLLGVEFLRRRVPSKAPNPAGGPRPQLGAAEEAQGYGQQAAEGRSAGLEEGQGMQGEEAFYDAQEELPAQPSMALPPAAVPMAAAAWATLASLDLRTQPDEVQWTAADAGGLLGSDTHLQQARQQQAHAQQVAAEMESEALAATVPPTQVVKQEPRLSGTTCAQKEMQAKHLAVVPGTEEETARLAEEAQRGEAQQVQKGGSGAGEESEDLLVEELLEPEPWATATIRGAKNRAEGVELFIEWGWGGGCKDVVPSWRLLGRPHCMETLIRFYESKSRNPKKPHSGKGSGKGGGEE